MWLLTERACYVGAQSSFNKAKTTVRWERYRRQPTRPVPVRQGPTNVLSKYSGSAGKPDGEPRKETST